jgi:hypothetical protein
MFISDNETAVDLLYYEAIAQTVVKLINETGENLVQHVMQPQFQMKVFHRGTDAAFLIARRHDHRQQRERTGLRNRIIHVPLTEANHSKLPKSHARRYLSDDMPVD